MPPPIFNIPPDDGRRLRFRLREIEITEAWVDDAIDRAGGYRISTRHSLAPGVKNCDYGLGRLLIELKMLEHDAIESSKRQTKLAQFFVEEGLSNPDGTTTVDSTKLPVEKKRKLWEIYLSGVERLVVEANKQVKATAAAIGMTDFKGVILLVNKECETLETKLLKRYAEHLIAKEKYSSLHYVLCFSVIPAIAPGSSPIIGCVSGPTETSDDRKLIDGIVDQFKAKIEVALGKSLDNAPDEIGPLSNLRDHRTFTAGDSTITLTSHSREAAEQNAHRMQTKPARELPH